MTETTSPLVEALNAAAPNGGLWEAGMEAYVAAIRDQRPLEEAYSAALDAAAPNEEFRRAGEEVLILRGELHSSSEEHASNRTSLKSKFQESKLAIRKLFNKDIDHEPKPGVVYFWAVVVYAFFGLLVAALLMMLLQVAIGFGWIHTTNNTAVAVLLYVIGTIAGACLGFAAASKQLQHREKQRIVAPTVPTPTPETA